MTEYVSRLGVFYENGERYGVLSDCEELWSRQIVETLIIEVAIMHKRDYLLYVLNGRGHACFPSVLTPKVLAAPIVK